MAVKHANGMGAIATKKHSIRITGPGARDELIRTSILQVLLQVIVQGSQRSLRMRTQGRSTARGALPRWIEQSSEFLVTVRSGSTKVEVNAPTLFEACPEEFRQTELFPAVNPETTAFEYLADSLRAALEGDLESPLYDRDLIKTFQKLDSIFTKGADELVFDATGPLMVTRDAVAGLKEIKARIPRPRPVKVGGKLDEIRYSDKTFAIILESPSARIRGIADDIDPETLQAHWGKRVLVTGVAYFTAAGSPLRIEAESISPARDRDLEIWGHIPVPLGMRTRPSVLRVAQGPRSGINAVVGRWPGEESEDELVSMLEDLS